MKMFVDWCDNSEVVASVYRGLKMILMLLMLLISHFNSY